MIWIFLLLLLIWISVGATMFVLQEAYDIGGHERPRPIWKTILMAPGAIVFGLSFLVWTILRIFIFKRK